MKKNVASQVVGAQMVSATDGSAFTGSVTCYVTGDGGTQAAGSVGSGACTHEGNGFHTYAPAQAETNYDHVAFTFTGTGAVPATVQIYTSFPQTGDSYARLGAPSGASMSADLAFWGQRGIDITEYSRGQHTVTGSVYYVDGVAGNDTTGSGTRSAPWKTISKAHTACTSNAHDLIILLPSASGGPTTITESSTINITKNYVQIRGPGRGVNVTLSTSGTVFNITGNGVQLFGMSITTNSGASSDAVNINSAADFVSVTRCWIGSAHRDGVQINVATNCFVEDCQITSAVRDGVRVSSGAGSGNYNKILRNFIRSAGGIGINLQGSDASNCRIQNNLVRDCPTGITIASGVSATSVTDNRFAGNTTNMSDSGTNTQHEWNRLATDITTGYVSADLINIAGSAVSTSTAQLGVNVVNAGGTAWASGSLTSGVFASGAITATAIAADAIGASELAADAVAEIADAVWDEALSGHLSAGSTGEALNASGSAGDPWTTALPGAYSAGQAGYIIGTNLNATVSSRLASASYTAPLDAAGTRSAVGLASANLDTQLDALPTAVENADALLGRNVSGGSSTGRTVKQALHFLRNKWAVSGGTLTVYDTDDTTSSWTATVTGTAGADPVTGSDPA